MLNKSEIEAKTQKLYDVLTGKNAQPLSVSEQLALAVSLQLLTSTLEAVHSIADSLAIIAKAKRFEQGWPDPKGS